MPGTLNNYAIATLRNIDFNFSCLYTKIIKYVYNGLRYLKRIIKSV